MSRRRQDISVDGNIYRVLATTKDGFQKSIGAYSTLEAAKATATRTRKERRYLGRDQKEYLYADVRTQVCTPEWRDLDED